MPKLTKVPKMPKIKDVDQFNLQEYFIRLIIGFPKIVLREDKWTP